MALDQRSTKGEITPEIHSYPQSNSEEKWWWFNSATFIYEKYILGEHRHEILAVIITHVTRSLTLVFYKSALFFRPFWIL